MTYSAPHSVTWYLTKRCNLTCTHCFVYETGEVPRRGDEELGLEDCRRVVDDLSHAGVFAIMFAGGEPLSLRWFPALIEYCGYQGIKTGASSNGALLTAGLARRLRGSGFSLMQLSLDGASEATHDAVRGKGNHRAVRRAHQICRNVGLESQFAFTLMRSNAHELDDLLALCLADVVSRLKLQLYLPTGRGEATEVLSPAEFRGVVDRCRDVEAASNGALKVTYPCYTGHLGNDAPVRWRPEAAAVELSCGAATTRGVIFEDGSIGACEFLRAERIGDVRTSSFMDIWNGGSEYLEQWRRLDLVHGKCGSCGYQADCGFGCRAAAYLLGGNFYGGDPTCISAPPAGVVHPHDLKTAEQRAAETAASPKRHLRSASLRVIR